MRFSNDFGIPEELIRAMRQDTYSRGNADISATGLIRPVQMAVLEKRHHDDIVVDARDEIWKLFGKATHHIIDQANAGKDDRTREKRLFAKIAGWTVSGAVDLLNEEDGELDDYKVTSTFAIGQDKPEWEQQLNIYAWLWRVARGVVVKQLRIIAILRDWRRAEAERNSEYPQAPVVPIPIELWSFEKQRQFVHTRVLMHQTAQLLDEAEHPLPECTDEDRWVRPPTWAVKKTSESARAIRVFDNEESAKEFSAGGRFIERRGGESIRCKSWCSVSQWCQQWNKENENG